MRATPSDHRSAAAIATAAGELLMELRSNLENLSVHPRLRRDEGDRRSHDFIVDALAREHPDDAVLSEEGADDLARLDAERVWIVDPLDGTREFGEPGRTDWAVHVALVIDGHVEAAAVALPALHATLTADPPPPPVPAHEGPPRLVVSRSRPPTVAAALAYHLDGEMLALGSAGAKAMAVVLGFADVYAHSGGQYEWDSAAPVGVAAAAGLHVSRLDGTALEYNRPDPWLPDLLICRPELVEPILAVTAGF
ncbi:MAG TPA: 3'(2'),5'-bisphosphate nucleotidase CysQ [Acidimicrobiia bacterium]|nr:3'(2'),5'-bisphosphate nucleotidase CysQ [Acidimicrobiia bacterium]